MHNWIQSDPTLQRQWERQNYMHVRHPFFTFLCCRWTTTPQKYLISRFMENVNKQQQNVISLSEIGYGPLEFNSRRVLPPYSVCTK